MFLLKATMGEPVLLHPFLLVSPGSQYIARIADVVYWCGLSSPKGTVRLDLAYFCFTALLLDAFENFVRFGTEGQQRVGVALQDFDGFPFLKLEVLAVLFHYRCTVAHDSCQIVENMLCVSISQVRHWNCLFTER
jgi:hypothetical protein